MRNALTEASSRRFLHCEAKTTDVHTYRQNETPQVDILCMTLLTVLRGVTTRTSRAIAICPIHLVEKNK
jgi:hypothetical protein